MADFLVPRRSVPVGRPCTLEDTVPARHLARFVWTVLESLDFTQAERVYESVVGGPGRPPYHPRVLTALWVYAMTQGMETAAEIARACTLRDDFRWIAGGLTPCDQTLLNFLGLAEDCLPSLWADVLKAMHRAGHIDLSALAEDGTKLRANASPRSFHTADQIAEVIEGLKTRLAQKLHEVLPQDGVKPHQIQVRALKDRLGRAERAAAELQARLEQRSGKHAAPASERASSGPHERATGKFGRSHFKLDGDRNVMICPAGQELAFVGDYSHEGGHPYRLYRKTDCGGCVLKPKCTEATGRRLKIPIHAASIASRSVPAPSESQPTPALAESGSVPSATPPDQEPPARQFDLTDFRREADRDVMICPAGQELTAIGTYSDDGCHAYRLYERADCTECSLKARCTKATGRRLKVKITSQNEQGRPGAAEAASAPPTVPSNGDGEPHEAASPQASLTDPEAVLMLATSQKRFEPSYNADITVTRHGVIVSQFLTKNPTDFPNFRRALPSVLATLGHPEAWIGDGHYGSLANLRLADQSSVLLYAPPAGGAPVASDKFPGNAFRPDPTKDVLVCPAGRELVKVGTYDTSDRPYDLYSLSDCTDCPLKPQCTDAPGRRVKRPHHLPLIEALEARMKEVGDRVMRFRGSTVEPVNGQLKQHGLGRFHVRGLARCGVVLTLACMGHNLMKWKAREDARILKLAA